ncbi:UDP-N-acetylmuramate dehydrogenase [Coralloluteibacterium stylophorae]|uniref:UDP-N-acetylenolpyruvoylglucosamine reductase n=1 Tax=Coralloluteibacterium stylophorae TaxID=1776034 RepID=A0A8J7VT09_9GAMM|nr:UDP-N-acetylmuramate dehydrogenase [Coralloluteibacterium stylophorae]MBS7455637.1 UDP-N-acetylmuramate dehydrogenase [Coralloluteibacterium stylophorae]
MSSNSGYTLARDASLIDRNTFRVDTRAALLVEVQAIEALPAALADPAVAGREPVLIGAGSNLLLAGDIPLALRIEADATTVLGQDASGTRIRAEAGLAWNDFLRQVLARGIAGPENMALIPGTIGAAPIQNIGAYGTEIGEFVETVEAWDRRGARVVRLPREACAFGYRDSVFKREAGRYVIVAVEFFFPAAPALRLDYAGLREELAAMGVATPTASDVADAVSRIRTRKLPDWRTLGNAGSFFKNPIVAAARADALAAAHPAMPVYPAGDDARRKLSAAWLIEACGWKGARQGDAGVAAQHALVLVNHGHATGPDILALAERIAASVEARFGVGLEPEPRIVGARFAPAVAA